MMNVPGNPEWFLARVDVLDTKGPQTTSFECSNWLSKDKGDGHIERDLMAKPKKRVFHNYRVKIKTGADKNMGTTARVYIRLHGMDGETSNKIDLLESFHDIKFEPGTPRPLWLTIFLRVNPHFFCMG